MKTPTRDRLAPSLWGEAEAPQPSPVPQKLPTEKLHVLTAAQQVLVDSLARCGVSYHPQAVCATCGCPFTWPSRVDPATHFCCRCFPRTKLYGEERHNQILALFPAIKKM